MIDKLSVAALPWRAGTVFPVAKSMVPNRVLRTSDRESNGWNLSAPLRRPT